MCAISPLTFQFWHQIWTSAQVICSCGFFLQPFITLQKRNSYKGSWTPRRSVWWRAKLLSERWCFREVPWSFVKKLDFTSPLYMES